MAVIVNGDGVLTGISSLATALTDLTSGRGTITGVTTVGTLQLGAGVSISSPRSQTAAIFTNNTEFLTVDDAGRVGVGTITPNSDAHPENEKKINVGFITAKSIAGDIDARNVVVAGVSTFVGAINGNVTGDLTGAATQITVAGETSDTTCFPVFVTTSTGNQAPKTRGTLTFNSSTGALTASSFVGDLPISNGANNRIVTTTGSASIAGESNLTFDGDGLLTMTSASGPAEMTFVAPSSADSGIYFNDGSNDGAVSYDHSTQNMSFRANALTRVKIDGPNNRILIKRTPSSDVDIVLAKAQRWGYSDSYQGLIIGNPAVGNMSSLFLNVDVSGNPNGGFTGDGREVVFRNNVSLVIPNAANDGFLTPIALNKGAATQGVPRFKQGLLFGTDTADANILDDYEEGTVSLKLRGNSTSTGELICDNGTYTKIGRIVVIKAQWVNRDASNLPQNQTISMTNAPFVPSGRHITSNLMMHKVSFDTSATQFFFTNSSGFVGYQSFNNATWAGWNTSLWRVSDMYFDFTAVYETTA